MRAVDLDLFVNSASKGWNDGAKVPSPFAAFINSISEGIDQNYKNDLVAEQAEGQRIQNEQAPFRQDVLEAQATEARLKEEAMLDDPDAFKDTVIAKAKVSQAEQQEKLDISMQRQRLNDLLKSGDGKAQGDAYVSGEFQQLFHKYPEEKKRYEDETFVNWDKDARSIYNTEQDRKRSIETNESLLDEAVKTYEKHKPDYVANPELNMLRNKIEADTGESVDDNELLKNGTMMTIRGAPQVPQMVDMLDAQGKPVLEADGKLVKKQQAPPDSFGNIPFMDKPFTSADKMEDRNVFKYGDKNYQIGAGFSKDTSGLFNTMQSSWRRKQALYKNQGGDTDLNDKVKAKEKAETEKIAKAQAAANITAEQVQTERQQFLQGADVATQEWAKKANIAVEETKVTPASTPTGPPALPQGRTSTTPEPTVSGPQTIPTPPQVLATAVATPFSRPEIAPTPGASQGGVPTPPPLTPNQQNMLIKKQAQATKGSQFLNKYQQSDKKVTPPVSVTAQAMMTTKSPYIPANLSTDIQYPVDKEAINRVAARPEMQGLSAFTLSVAVQESKGKNEATSPTGVTGIMQVTGGTGKQINPEFDRTNAVQQAVAGARTLSILLDKYRNNPMLAATAYNGGTVVVDEAIRMAGTTNWSIVKNFLEEAGNSPRAQAAWRRDFERAGFSNSKINKLLKTKPAETKTYAEKVIVNFPSFAFNADDNAMIQVLKQQGVFKT